jgi:hypothetical protein
MHDITDTAPSLWTRVRAMFARAAAALLLRPGGGDAALGMIAEIACCAELSRQRRAKIIAWLAPLENVVRKLLLTKAAALHRAERAAAMRAPRIERVPLAGMAHHWNGRTASLQARPAPAVAEKSAPEHPRAKVDPARPETWRAHFSLAIPRDPRRIPDARAPRIRALWDDDTHARRAASPSVPQPNARVCHALSPAFRLARRFEALRRVLENPSVHAERLARALARETRRRSSIMRDYLFAPCRANGHDPADPRLTVDAICEAFDALEAFDSS